MSTHAPKIVDFLYSDTAFPVVDWEAIAEWIELNIPPAEHFECWTECGRRWLAEINNQFSNEYELVETEHFLLFGFPPRIPLKAYARFAEFCHQGILYGLPNLAEFQSPGKVIVIIFSGVEVYYSHVADYHPEGEFGGSAGTHIRLKYSHVAILEREQTQLNMTLAHELTHAALGHLTMPLWLEEGLTQMFEHDLASRMFVLDPQEVGEQKAYWRENGLAEFWSGTGFHSPGEVQKYSYQLAEILIRLLLIDFRARWFGFDRRPLIQLMNFLRDAKIDDAGEASAIAHLKLNLSEIAAKSIGNTRAIAANSDVVPE